MGVGAGGRQAEHPRASALAAGTARGGGIYTTGIGTQPPPRWHSSFSRACLLDESSFRAP